MGYQILNLNSHRKGFSLVELLIAMAIIIFMLTIMSQAFVIATTCMQGLKGVGELLDKGRPVLAVLQKDLSAYHFDGMRRLSDEDFWVNGPPSQGYFHIYQGGFSTVEGVTNDGVGYEISGNGSDHRLAFTSRLSGKNPDDFYIASLSSALGIVSNFSINFNTSKILKDSENSKRYDFFPEVLHSMWAEIAYFVKLNPSKTANGTQLMDLYRQQKLILPSNAEINALNIPYAANSIYETFSCRSDGATPPAFYFNSASDLTSPANRMVTNTTFSNANLLNSDLLLTDVISFDVRILPDSSLNDFQLLSNVLKTKTSYLPSPSFLPNPPNPLTSNDGYNFMSSNGNYPIYFDTWTLNRQGAIKYDLGDFSTGVWQPSAWGSTRIPFWYYQWSPGLNNYYPVKGLRINAIQVSIRVWDEKSQKAREFKLIQRL
jgi:prepilin-type N-terminal cleavage/methylation domain-containing protein